MNVAGDEGAKDRVRQLVADLVSSSGGTDTDLAKLVHALLPSVEQQAARKAIQQARQNGSVPGRKPPRSKEWPLTNPQILVALKKVALQQLGSSAGHRWSSDFDIACRDAVTGGAPFAASLRARALAGAVFTIGGRIPVGGDLDPRHVDRVKDRWGQRSGEVGGEVPAYVHRDCHELLTALLRTAASTTQPTQRLVTVIGRPASGKTRLALQVLAELFPRHRVIAPRATHHALSEVVRHLRIESETNSLRSTLVLLDDLQLWFDPYDNRGRLEAALRGLADLPIVTLATVHEQRLPEPFGGGDVHRARIDTTGLSDELIEWLRDPLVSVRVNDRLSQYELQRSSALREQLAAHAKTLHADLAYQLASIDKMDKLWRSTTASGTVSGDAKDALLTVLLDAAFTDPEGLEDAEVRRRVQDLWQSRFPDLETLPNSSLNHSLEWARRPPDTRFSFVVEKDDRLRMHDGLATRRRKTHEISIEPDSMTAAQVFNTAVVHYRESHLSDAEQWYLIAAERHRHPRAMVNLGVLLMEQGRVEEARRWYYVAAEDHSEPDAMINLGALLADSAPDEAERWFRQAAEVHGAPDAMVNLGVFYANHARYEEAETWSRIAAEQHDDPGAKYHLGVALEHLGRADEAAQWFRIAADAHGDQRAAVRLAELENRTRQTSLTDVRSQPV